MNSNITLTQEQLIELYEFMAEANRVFHQPMNYGNEKCIEAFATTNYPTIRKFYYDVLWDKLPIEIKNKILDE